MENMTATQVITKSETSVGVRLLNGVLVGLGAALIAAYSMAGVMTAKEGGLRNTDLGDGWTTCGTYTGDRIPGGTDDGGLNRPFALNGRLDADCANTQHPNTCQNGETPCILGEPAPTVYTSPYLVNGQRYWGVMANWRTDVSTSANLFHYIRTDAPVNGGAWRCIWGGYWGVGDGTCDPFIFTLSGVGYGTNHTTYQAGGLPDGKVFYYGVESAPGGGLPALHSEIRTFSTVSNGGGSPMYEKLPASAVPLN